MVHACMACRIERLRGFCLSTLDSSATPLDRHLDAVRDFLPQSAADLVRIEKRSSDQLKVPELEQGEVNRKCLMTTDKHINQSRQEESRVEIAGFDAVD